MVDLVDESWWIMVHPHGGFSWWIWWMNHGGSCGSWWIWHPRDHLLEMFSPQNNRPTKGGFSWKLTLTRTFEFWPYLTGSNFRRGYLYPFTLDLISLPGPFDDFRTFTYIHIYTLKPRSFCQVWCYKTVTFDFFNQIWYFIPPLKFAWRITCVVPQ